MIEPVMDGWIVQWYLNVPTRLKVRLNVAPGARVLFHSPVFEVVVCVVFELFFHFTVVPRAMLAVFGMNAKFTTETFLMTKGVRDRAAAGAVVDPNRITIPRIVENRRFMALLPDQQERDRQLNEPGVSLRNDP
jgi:hypothetical protein